MITVFQLILVYWYDLVSDLSFYFSETLDTNIFDASLDFYNLQISLLDLVASGLTIATIVMLIVFVYHIFTMSIKFLRGLL